MRLKVHQTSLLLHSLLMANPYRSRQQCLHRMHVNPLNNAHMHAETRKLHNKHNRQSSKAPSSLNRVQPNMHKVVRMEITNRCSKVLNRCSRALILLRKAPNRCIQH